MITDKEIWNLEKARLAKVVDEIKVQLDNGADAASKFKKEAIDLQRKMWEEVKLAPVDLSDLEGATQIWQYQTDISNQARKYKFSYAKIKQLERMYKSPYFGRIDFVEDGEEKEEQIYIGIHNLVSGKNREILVYDWRAPVAGMFYDYETGLCGYDCPAGKITGQMLLKRQYKIENSVIDYMFDSGLSINDEILREILGKSTDNRMKTIVTSIQREQNTVIRNSEDRILVVEGPAGSGKTSIALHRAAYILYKYKESIKSDNILVFSPNDVFGDYISNVLPELGEDNVPGSTFAGFFGHMLGKDYKFEKMNEQMEYILSGYAEKARLRCIKFKSSVQFLSILKKYVQYLENGMCMEFENIKYDGNGIISADEICQLFNNDYSRFPYAKRLEKLRQRLFYLLEQCEENRVRQQLQQNFSDEEEARIAEQNIKEEYESIKNSIIKMTTFDIHVLYRNLFEIIGRFAPAADKLEHEDIQSIGIYTVRQLNQGIINYEDAAPIVYLNTFLDAVNGTKSIKHVIIDEAQDYTVIQYEIFKKVFGHCKMTILGDINQSVNSYMNIGCFKSISDIFDGKDTRSITLTKSYRSSKEIADFCKQLLVSQNGSEQLNRHGNKPKITQIDKTGICKRISEDIILLKNRGFNLIAVISKTAVQCEAFHKALNSYVDISLISNKNEEYPGGVIVIPSYLAKGLEFDAVLVASAEEGDYAGEEDRSLLYTVCTRALHELNLYYSDNLSCLIEEIDESYYLKEKVTVEK